MVTPFGSTTVCGNPPGRCWVILVVWPRALVTASERAAAVIGEFGHFLNIGARILRGGQQEIRPGVGPGARLPVGRIGRSAGRGVGQRLGQQVAAAVVSEVRGQARRHDLRRKVVVAEIGDRGRAGLRRADRLVDGRRLPMHVVDIGGLIAVPVGHARRIAVAVIGEGLGRGGGGGGRLPIDLRHLRHALESREFVQ